LIDVRKADLGFSPGDVLYDSFVGQDKFKTKVPVRTLLNPYYNFIHL